MKLDNHIVSSLQYKSVKFEAPSSLRFEVMTKKNLGRLIMDHSVVAGIRRLEIQDWG